MSTEGPCENATSPINITTSDLVCSNVCDYKYSYALSDCQLSNQGDYIAIKTNTTGNNVTFNNTPFNLIETRLYQPSLHTFNGVHLTAELIIQHMSGDQNLLICIPVTTSNGKSKSVDFFNSFLPYAPQNEGAQTNVNVNNWSLNNVVPIGGYYYYRATAPFPPCTGIFNIIVFDKSSVAQMSSDDLPHLTSVITRNTLRARDSPAGGLYYNSSGTISQGAGSNDIYIDCQPVGSGEEEDDDIHVTHIPKPFKHPNFKKFASSKYASVAIGVILLIVLKKVYDKVLDKLF